MRDAECVAFLQWALPRLQMRWEGFRRVRRQVCKRIQRRLGELGLADVSAYRHRLQADPGEWAVLDRLCRVTISRFYRDRRVFEFLARQVLPELADHVRNTGRRRLTAWSAGCGAGEEPYTLVMVWQQRLQTGYPELSLHVLATDADPGQCRRAEVACYGWGSIKNLPDAWRKAAFDKRGTQYCLRAPWRQGVTFRVQDVRQQMPDGPFDLVLCRNLAFTYFDAAGQCRILQGIRDRLRPGGALVLGIREQLPEGSKDFEPWESRLRIYRRVSDGSRSASRHACRNGW